MSVSARSRSSMSRPCFAMQSTLGCRGAQGPPAARLSRFLGLSWMDCGSAAAIADAPGHHRILGGAGADLALVDLGIGGVAVDLELRLHRIARSAIGQGHVVVVARLRAGDAAIAQVDW